MIAQREGVEPKLGHQPNFLNQVCHDLRAVLVNWVARRQRHANLHSVTFSKGLFSVTERTNLLALPALP